MKFDIKFSYRIRTNEYIDEDHCLVVLPTTEGIHEFTSIHSLEELVTVFGNRFYNEEGVLDDDYSLTLLNSLSSILDSGMPLLAISAKSAVRSSIRVYHNENDLSVCSISHSGKSFFENKKVFENAAAFIERDILSSSTIRTLVHSLPLKIVIDESGEEVSVLPEGEDVNYHGWFITLPVQRLEDGILNEEMPSYIIYVNNKDKSDYNDLYKTTVPIFDGEDVVVLNCLGNRQRVEKSITNLNKCLEARYQIESEENPTISHYKVLLDWEGRCIKFLCNQYTNPSAMYSLPGGTEFLVDYNDSGYILDKYTKDCAILDIVSKSNGVLGNYDSVKLENKNGKFYLSYIQNKSEVEEVEIFTGGNIVYNPHYFTMEVYDNSAETLTELLDYLTFPKALSGGSNSTPTCSDVGDTIVSYFKEDYPLPITYIFDCGYFNDELIGTTCRSIASYDNPNILLVAKRPKTINPVSKSQKWRVMYYKDYEFKIALDERIFLGALIINNLNLYNFTPVLNIIIDEECKRVLEETQTDVVCPRLDQNRLILDDIPMLGLSYEDTIDVLIMSRCYTEIDRKLGTISSTLDKYPSSKYQEILESYLQLLDVFPSLVSGFEGTISRIGRTVSISLITKRQELASGTRVLRLHVII